MRDECILTVSCKCYCNAHLFVNLIFFKLKTHWEKKNQKISQKLAWTSN